MPDAVHPDFATPEDLTLISSDGVHFNIASTHLARTSSFFRGMFDLPPPPGTKPGAHSLTLLEDSATLDVLLKLVLGLPAPPERLSSWQQVNPILRAAEKYDIQGALQFLAAVVRGFVAAMPPLEQYAYASHYGWTDIANVAFDKLLKTPIDFKAVPPVMDGVALARLLAARQTRVDQFLAGLRGGGIFKYENKGVCGTCGAPHSHVFAWRAVVAAVSLQFALTVSLDAALGSGEVVTAIAALENARCGQGHCGKVLFPWNKVRALLEQIA
ncbi:hypothetical protein EXIGLDRAFT_730261 [Exidia glandulosa HHB12029]|uniref:BTB domain-containing protein n=1 Tax=Exidia glandulosa HHB12029 TaxID=1314781 RepID=A0A165LA35_EXIGL|nr:hypothetical protein EXIGLDRAFT_730261 [Exidia glandulosa HHB12029]